MIIFFNDLDYAYFINFLFYVNVIIISIISVLIVHFIILIY